MIPLFSRQVQFRKSKCEFLFPLNFSHYTIHVILRQKKILVNDFKRSPTSTLIFTLYIRPRKIYEKSWLYFWNVTFSFFLLAMFGTNKKWNEWSTFDSFHVFYMTKRGPWPKFLGKYIREFDQIRSLWPILFANFLRENKRIELSNGNPEYS